MVSACPFLSLLHPPGDGEIRTACGSSGVGTPAFHVNKITPSVLFTARVGMLSCWVALFYVLSALRWWFRSTVNHDSRTSFIVACSWTQPHLGTVSNTFPGCSISSSMSMAIFLLVFSVFEGFQDFFTTGCCSRHFMAWKSLLLLPGGPSFVLKSLLSLTLS